MRLSVSPATPFSVASLPNHTKMFELVHVVTSMEDFDVYRLTMEANLTDLSEETGGRKSATTNQKQENRV